VIDGLGLFNLTIVMLLELHRLTVPPGHKLLLEDVNWNEFESILNELGEHRSSRIAYDSQILEIMTPLPEHEVNKVLVSNLVEVLLEELEIEFWSLGSTTFKSQLIGKGIEPDNCFYIENEAKVRGKDRLNLAFDPPPDLVLEIEITSRTHPNIYQSLGVPELWRFDQGQLQINILENGEYIELEESPHFPGFPLKKVIPDYLKQFKVEGRNKTLKEFRAWVRKKIGSVAKN
jgi:Uma2 family endonuclease